MEISGKNVLFFEICRLCLDNQGSFIVSKANRLFDKVYNCTGVEIKPCDDLPQEICSACLDIVNKADSLRTLALQNDTHLKTLFSECTECENVSPQSTDDIKSPSKKKRKMDSRSECECTVPSPFTDDLKPSSTIKIKKSNDRTVFECTICSKVYDSWRKLYFHNKTHNKNIHCPLDECGKKFATRGDLKKHMRSHTGEKPFRCNECDKSFTQKVTLKAHKLAVHSVFS